MQQVANFAKWVQPTEIVFLIENSQRIGKDLLKHFSAYRFGNGEIEIQPKVLLANKDVRASCVEVADFVVHPAGHRCEIVCGASEILVASSERILMQFSIRWTVNW